MALASHQHESAGLAEQYLSEFLSKEYDDALPARSMCDQLLRTAHERMEPPIAS